MRAALDSGGGGRRCGAKARGGLAAAPPAGVSSIRGQALRASRLIRLFR